MKPSFYSMFSRSKYRQATPSADTEHQRERVTDSDETDLEDSSLERQREEKERFAVVAIAFCLKYDQDFKNHFLSLLLPKGSHYKSEKLRVEVEPKQSSDLILKSDGTVIVVEHKIDSDLKPHQDPWSEEFKDRSAQPKGYAIQIRNQHPGASKILYRVLSKQTFKQRQVLGIDCAAIRWPEILLPKEKPNSLHNDLYDCLAKLGVASFTFRHMKGDLKLAKQALRAAEVCSLLRAVSEEAGLKYDKISDGDAGWDGDEYYYFGLPVRGRAHDGDSTRASRLSKLVSSGVGQIGWFGYEKKEGESSVLSVYFYCGTPAARQKVLTKLEQSKIGKIEAPDLEVRVTCDAAESPGDKSWFLRVFDTLVPKASV